MKYMVLLYAEPQANPEPGTPAFDALMNDFATLEERIAGRAAVVAGEGLLGVETATTVRVRGGRASVTDGPFAETREHLGGFFVIEANTLDDALAFAAAVPVAAYGSIEVRPVEIFE